MYRDGSGYAKIGFTLGVSPSTVRRWIVSASVEGHLSLHDPPGYDEDFRKEAIDYYLANEDMSIAECAYIHGVSATTMSRWLRRHGEAPKAASDLRKFDHDEIVRRIERGDKGAHIAGDLGCSEALVSRIRRQLREAKQTKFDHEAILADLKSGMTGAAVSQKHGCSPSLVSFIRGKYEQGKEERKDDEQS